MYSSERHRKWSLECNGVDQPLEVGNELEIYHLFLFRVPVAMLVQSTAGIRPLKISLRLLHISGAKVDILMMLQKMRSQRAAKSWSKTGDTWVKLGLAIKWRFVQVAAQSSMVINQLLFCISPAHQIMFGFVNAS